ncbi:MAG TPA: Ig-like domain-containing protein [Acidimicrobiia bacterium]|nr:Ig-like domain-containing protein [Acidimicrobiia bacterium]
MRRLIVLVVLAGLSVGLVPVSAPAEGDVAFGAHPGGTNDGRVGATTDLETAIGRQLDFVRVFEVWNSPFPTAFHDYLMAKNQKILLSVRAKRTNGTYVQWRDIADAQPGSAIHDQMVAWIERVRAIGQPVWFTFNHEPEYAENVANGVASDFIAAWRRVITEFRDRGVDNVEFVWIMTDWSFHVPPSDRRHAPLWYPGDNYVDYIAADAYNWSTCRPNISLPWQSLEPIIEPLRQFGARHPDKGVMLAEWGSSTQGGDKAAWIAEVADLLKGPGWEQFVAVSYFSRTDQNYPECNFPLDSSPEVMAAFAAMGADPFYGGGGDPPPPPPTNLVFSGTADATNEAGPRWQSGTYTPSSSRIHDFTLDWTGSANLRMDIRQASNNAWVGANTSTDQPKELSVALTAGTTYRIAIWSMSGAAQFSVVEGDSVPVDEPPTVALTTPTDGATVSGSVSVTADAADDDAVVSVEFSVNGSSIGVDTDGTNGWSVPWDTTAVVDGSYQVEAVAADTADQAATDTIGVTVDNEGEPEPEVVFDAAVDATNATSPRWTSTLYTPAASGQHTLTLDWATTANLRFDIRVASNGNWIGANTSTAQPKTITVDLQAGTAYRIAVWSMSGQADFEVTAGPS